MLSRRAFLQTTGAVGTAAWAANPRGLEPILAASASVANQSPQDVAKDEFYWREIQQSFALDRSVINLNTGHHCSQPSLRRYGVESTVRPSLAFYNTFEEIDRLVGAVKRIMNS